MRRALLVTLVACSGDAAVADLSIDVLTDINPDPNIVEVELVATAGTHEYLDGKPADIWGFRDGAIAGSKPAIPGPMIEAKLGDRVIVHFKNELPEHTTIHWHGLRVANSFDGTTASQTPIQPNETFDYELEMLDAGLFWYHPHMHGDVQIEAGLYAPFLVHAPADAAIEVAADRVFVLDDVKLEANGKLSARTDNLDVMLGRQGNVIVVNGRERASFTAAAGNGRERWRFVNSANGRYFNLELGRPFFVIGSDGGLVETPYETERLLIAPGERYEVVVDLDGEAGERLVLRTLHYDRGHDIPDPGPIDLFTVELRPAAPRTPLPTSWGQIAPIALDAQTPRRRFVLEEDDSIPANPIFTINAQAFPDITPIEGRAGAIEIWEIDNRAEMDHPFHLHGMFFQVLDTSAPLAWKDTVNVPREQVLRVAVRFGEPGRWMFHCHILEHAERGMMGELAISP